MCLSLNNCCFCISLSAGAKTISVISTFSSAAIFMLYVTPAALNASLEPMRRYFYAAVAAAAFLQMIFGCFLVHGTFRKKPKFTWPWILVAWWESVGVMALAVAGVLLVAYSGDTAPTSLESTVIFVYFLYGLILYYFTSVVNRRRHEMASDEYKYLSKNYLSKSLVRRTNYYI